MKFKTRDQKISEYNASYKTRETDPEKRLREYFKKRGWNIEKAIKKAKKKFQLIESKREYESVHILLYEYPMKTDRPRTFKNHTFSPNAAANKKYFDRALKQVIKVIKLINTPAEISIEAYLEMPAQVPPDEVILFEAKVLDVLDMPDYDNIGKCYTDILKDVLISDDDIFHHGSISKFYSVLPRVDIYIRYLKYHESDYIYKKLKHRKGIKAAIAANQLILCKIGES